MATDESQRDAQWGSASLFDAIRAVVQEDRKTLHTALPGIVQSFDAAKQTARVRPAIKRVWIDDGPKDLPDCVDVPVHFPRGGGFVLTFPVAPGDECLLVFAERAIDGWFTDGGTQAPSEVRFHDLSDGFAVVGFSSLGRVVAGLSTDAVELRTLDGVTVLRIEAGKIYVGAKAGAEPTLLGTTYRQAEAAMDNTTIAALTALAVFASAVVANPTELATFTGTYPTIGALIGGLAAFVPLWMAALQQFELTSPTYLSRKAEVF